MPLATDLLLEQRLFSLATKGHFRAYSLMHAFTREGSLNQNSEDAKILSQLSHESHMKTCSPSLWAASSRGPVQAAY